MPHFKSIIFSLNRPEIKLVLQKKSNANAKSPSAGGSAQTPLHLAAGATLSPDPEIALTPLQISGYAPG